MIIGFFGISNPAPKCQNDRSYVKQLSEMIGPGHQVKAAFTVDGVEYFNTFASKAKAANLDAAIVTDPELLGLVMRAMPTFKQGYNKGGGAKKLTLNDYHGSFITLPGSRIGREQDLDVLFLNPLSHLNTVPEAKFIFKRHISKITHPNKWFPQTEFTWELADASNIDNLYAQFRDAILMALDVETDEDSPLRTINCAGYCALFADGSTHTVVIPIKSMWGVLWMRKFNELPAPKVLQGGLYDHCYYARYNSPVYNWLWDTQNLFHSWYSELPKRLDYIAAFCLRKVHFWKDDGKSGNLFDHYEYNGRDCWATLMACCALIMEMPDWAKRNYLEEFPVNFPALHTELDGLHINEFEFGASQAKVKAALIPHEQALAKWIGPNFNPGSSDQVKRLMRCLGGGDKNGIVESSDEQHINALAAVHPLNEKILSEVLEVRGYRKLLSTYIVYDKFWNNRLYYKSNVAGTDTMRMAVTESSYWCGIPINVMPRGPEVKSFISADPGWDGLCEGDFAQAEARCVGYISGCESLINLVESEYDYHAWNAQSFFGIPYNEIYDQQTGKTILKDIRDLSKRTNHGANYNMGAAVMLSTMGPKAVGKAKRVLKLPVGWTLLEVCGYLLRQYEKTYPEVKVDWQEWIKRTIALTHKLVSPLGWTRYFFGNPMANKPALNAAVAHGPQNLNVNILNRAYYKIWRRSVYGDLRGIYRIKAQIHDSILGCYKGKDTPEKIRQLMIYPIDVTDIKGVTRTMKIPVDMKSGNEIWSKLK